MIKNEEHIIIHEDMSLTFLFGDEDINKGRHNALKAQNSRRYTTTMSPCNAKVLGVVVCTVEADEELVFWIDVQPTQQIAERSKNDG